MIFSEIDEVTPTVFEARFYSTCPRCHERIVPGEQCSYDDWSEVVHEECA